MAYALLIYEQRGRRPKRDAPDGQREYEQMQGFGERLAKRGILKAADALKGDAEGARVTIRSGKTAVVDGPFSEAKEMIGGFFLLDCGTREDAIAIAKECPAAAWATVEVREIGTCYDD